MIIERLLSRLATLPAADLLATSEAAPVADAHEHDDAGETSFHGPSPERSATALTVAGLPPPRGAIDRPDLPRLDWRPTRTIDPGSDPASPAPRTRDKGPDAAPRRDAVVTTEMRPGVGLVQTTMVDGTLKSSEVVASDPASDATSKARPAEAIREPIRPNDPVGRTEGPAPTQDRPALDRPAARPGPIEAPRSTTETGSADRGAADPNAPRAEAEARMVRGASTVADRPEPSVALADLVVRPDADSATGGAKGPHSGILNAAMIPGWPPPRAPGPAPLANGTAPPRPSSAVDDPLLEQLAALGIDADEVARHRARADRKTSRLRKALARIGLAAALLAAIVEAIADELGDLAEDRARRADDTIPPHGGGPSAGRVYVK